MVLPLIPLAVIAVSAAGGAGGVTLGGKGVVDITKARKKLSAAERRYEQQHKRTEDAVRSTNRRLKRLGEQQGEALESVVLRMGEFLRRHQKQVRESERLLVDGIDVTRSSVSSSPSLDVDAVAWVRGVVGSAAVGGGMSVGVSGAAATYGVASTGVAISGLSGAAAESATLAFLGGGSLASGGGGMALGATVLNVAAIGPALLVGGAVVKNQGSKARTQAKKYEAKVAVEVEKLKKERAVLKVVDTRSDELSDLLARLRRRAVAALDLLESEPFVPESHVERFQHAMSLVVAVRDVAATPVVDGSGQVNDKTEDLRVRYRPMVQEDDDA